MFHISGMVASLPESDVNISNPNHAEADVLHYVPVVPQPVGNDTTTKDSANLPVCNPFRGNIDSTQILGSVEDIEVAYELNARQYGIVLCYVFKVHLERYRSLSLKEETCFLSRVVIS